MASSGLLFVGIIFSMGGASFLALSMVIQRYALSYPDEKVPLLSCRFPRMFVWFLGLVTYGIGCVLYVISLIFGPLILMGSIFTTLLIWNMIFARWLLKEPLTPPKIACSGTILLGVCFVVIGTPSDIPVNFTPKEIIGLLEKPGASVYVAILFSLVIVSVISIFLYERQYPGTAESHSEKDVGAKNMILRSNVTIPLDDHKKEWINGCSSTKTQSPIAPPGEKPQNVKRGEIAVTATTIAPVTVPPIWLDDVMGFLYPASMGMDEGVASLTMKASLTMLANCTGNECNSWIVYIACIIWISSSLATVWWLKNVFGRYQTTKALPIEYGALNVASMCSGLIFYREYTYLADWQLTLVLVGLGIILVGLAIGRCNSNVEICAYSSGEDADGMKGHDKVFAIGEAGNNQSEAIGREGKGF
mmetsp:Transcript_39485/g.66189  ORF Transcript_39485/g.66189 Transcript_39485/m.66189 type:complete len:418 (-) Transcript_39485:50-1303(-)|eukprot:jgi/Bigna1/70695/fgenesh1_pg.13_\